MGEGRLGEYNGDWVDDLPEGEGTWTFGNTTYVGSWKKGKYDGKGTLTRLGFTYTGRWKDNKQNGIGTATWKDGSSYGILILAHRIVTPFKFRSCFIRALLPFTFCHCFHFIDLHPSI